MDNKELNRAELNDDALENVSGGLTYGCTYACKACGERFTYTEGVKSRVGACCPYCGAAADVLKLLKR